MTPTLVLSKEKEESMEQEKVKFNGVYITEDQLEMKKKEINQQFGMKLVEVAPKEYKTRIEG